MFSVKKIQNQFDRRQIRFRWMFKRWTWSILIDSNLKFHIKILSNNNQILSEQFNTYFDENSTNKQFLRKKFPLHFLFIRCSSRSQTHSIQLESNVLNYSIQLHNDMLFTACRLPFKGKNTKWFFIYSKLKVLLKKQ